MKRLPLPIKDVLRDPADDVDVQELWLRVANAPPPQDNLQRRAIARIGVIVATAAVIATALVVTGDRDPAELRLITGEGPDALSVSAEDAPRAHDFSDGSRVIVLPGTELVTLENGPLSVRFLLSRGQASFEVRPHGPRKWTIECGLATIEVIGTRFFIERSERKVRVSVEEGVVLVSGERVPDRVRRLGAGQSIEVVDAEPAPAPVIAPLDAPIEVPPAAVAPKKRSIASPPPAAPPEPVPEIPPEEPPAISPSTLFAQADQARLRGEFDEAALLLEELVRNHEKDPNAAVAAYTLGRLYLENLDRPAEAASAFERSLSLGLPRALRESAVAHLERARRRPRGQEAE